MENYLKFALIVWWIGGLEVSNWVFVFNCITPLRLTDIFFVGVTAVRPDDINLPNTATDLSHDTWMLSGCSIMENGTTTKNNYCCDLDTLSAGTRLGVMRTADRKLVYYKDGVSQGVACTVPPTYVYVVVDLYGQCAQVSIPFVSPTVQVSCAQDAYTRSDTTVSLQVMCF